MSLDCLVEAMTAEGGVLYSDKYSRSQSQYEEGESSASPLPTPRKRASSKMDDGDKLIYNSLGDTSGAKGKMTYSELGLHRGWQKRGIMWKTGPEPSWYTPWRKRVFVLKDNFLYYLPSDQRLRNAPILGAIYLKNAMVEKISLPFAKRVLSITPPVPRRKGWENDESSVFHIRFKTEEGRNEWFEDLQQVSFQHKFPERKLPNFTNSMKFKHDASRDKRSW